MDSLRCCGAVARTTTTRGATTRASSPMKKGKSTGRRSRSSGRTAPRASSSSGENDVEVVIKVPDMMCEGCSETVTNALKSESSVGEISIDLETKLVSVNVRGCASAVEAMAKIPTLVEALKENGFDSEPVFD